MSEKRMFVLDTNVLMHDPTAMFRFQEHDVYVPMVVLEELDAAKKGTSDIARNVREVSRILEAASRCRVPTAGARPGACSSRREATPTSWPNRFPARSRTTGY